MAAKKRHKTIEWMKMKKYIKTSNKLKLSDLNLGFVNSVRKMYGFY